MKNTDEQSQLACSRATALFSQIWNRRRISL